MLVSMRWLFFIIIPLFLVACSELSTAPDPRIEKAKPVAEEFITSSPTYAFDGHGLAFRSATASNDGVVLYYRFFSTYSGYGDRSLEEVPTRIEVKHDVVITVKNAQVVTAVLDEQWDMLTQEFVGDSFLCPADIRTCLDGSFVTRDPKNDCRFRPCDEGVACADDVFTCPDGSVVQRDPNNGCEFFACII